MLCEKHSLFKGQFRITDEAMMRSFYKTNMQSARTSKEVLKRESWKERKRKENGEKLQVKDIPGFFLSPSVPLGGYENTLRCRKYLRIWEEWNGKTIFKMKSESGMRA